MIEIRELNFGQVDDPIKTEEFIYHQLKDLELKVPYVAFPIAYSINTLGIGKTQSLIDKINSCHPFKKFFVCQHIFVNRLNFGSNLVFTPHTEKGDPYFFIPHYNPIYQEPPGKKSILSREINFCFVGDFNTSSDRLRLSHFSYPETTIKSTGKWFFSHDKEIQKELFPSYKVLLENTKVSLCPRGTGPSTLRLFESMSVGAIPLVFNNLDLPEEIEKFVIKADLEEFISGNLTEDILSKDLQDFSDGIYEEYWKNFSNSNLSKSILKVIKK